MQIRRIFFPNESGTRAPPQLEATNSPDENRPESWHIKRPVALTWEAKWRNLQAQLVRTLLWTKGPAIADRSIPLNPRYLKAFKTCLLAVLYSHPREFRAVHDEISKERCDGND
jgi:hypothetical protein